MNLCSILVTKDSRKHTSSISPMCHDTKFSPTFTLATCYAVQKGRANWPLNLMPCRADNQRTIPNYQLEKSVV